MMFAEKTKILLVLPSDVLDRARALAGKATTTFKMPVSLQIVLRGLIEEGLRRGDAPALMENFERQARTVRDIRRTARMRGGDGGARSRPLASRRTAGRSRG
jgi:hypothetical protein